MTANDPILGAVRATFSQEAVREFQVLTSSYSAEFGKASGGVVNIVTGDKEALAKVLAEHDDVDAVWYFGTQDGAATVERASACNMKRTWIARGRDWHDARQAEGPEFLRHAAEIKNIWVPYGE